MFNVLLLHFQQLTNDISGLLGGTSVAQTILQLVVILKQLTLTFAIVQHQIQFLGDIVLEPWRQPLDI